MTVMVSSNEEDLYPNNPYICLVANDFDCDGFDINEDCDDSNIRFGSVENDTDCDGLSMISILILTLQMEI